MSDCIQRLQATMLASLLNDEQKIDWMLKLMENESKTIEELEFRVQ